jgi:hypothetical protein
MKYFIGLDAHSSTSTFAVLNEIGECVLRKTVDTSEKNLWHVLECVSSGYPTFQAEFSFFLTSSS